MKKKNKVLMVFPPLGMSGSFVRHAPISLLYASSRLVKLGFEVEVFDARLCASTWREELLARLDESVLLVGVSVMTGAPVMRAVEIAEVVKNHDSDIHVVWGGPFATFNPEISTGGSTEPGSSFPTRASTSCFSWMFCTTPRSKTGASSCARLCGSDAGRS